MGRFIQDDDYELLIREEIKNLLDASTAQSKILKAEKVAISQMKKRLTKRYDVDVLFAPAPDTGDDPRDPFIVMTVIDIALYHIWTAQAPGRMPKVRADRYQDAVDWLKEEGSGEGGNGDLPEKVADDYASDFRVMSRPPNNQKW